MMGIRFGGGENVDLNLADYMQRRGNKVRIIAGRTIFGSHVDVGNKKRNVEIIYLRTPYLRGVTYLLDNYNNFFLSKLSSLLRELDFLLFNIVVWFYLRKDKWTNVYQILSIPLLGMWLKSEHKKTVIRFPGPPGKRQIKSVQKCDACFANGDAYQYCIKEGLLSIKQINIGVDLERFKFSDTKKETGYFTFLYVGRIVSIKNIPFLIEAFAEAYKINNKIRLIIVGEGESRDTIKVSIMIDKYNLNEAVFLKGRKTDNNLIEEYQKADCFVLSSDYDNFPNVVLEAMAAGLPVVATNTGGIPRQVINNVNGILVPVRDVEEFKKAMVRISIDTDMAKRMGRKSREVVEQNFSWERTVEELEKLYRQLNRSE